MKRLSHRPSPSASNRHAAKYPIAPSCRVAAENPKNKPTKKKPMKKNTSKKTEQFISAVIYTGKDGEPVQTAETFHIDTTFEYMELHAMETIKAILRNVFKTKMGTYQTGNLMWEPDGMSWRKIKDAKTKTEFTVCFGKI